MLSRRTLLGSLLSIATTTPVLIVLPVLSTQAAPHPVAPHVQTLKLGAVSAHASGLAQTATSGFRMVGATWSPGAVPAGDTVQVSVRAAGSWSDWTALSPQDSGPDGNTPDARAAGRRVSTEPLWVDHADGVRVRVVDAAGQPDHVVDPADVRLSLIDPGSSAADADVTKQPASSAQAAVAQPTIFTRAQWGADESLRTVNPGCGTPDYGTTISMGFVHHTDTSNDYSQSDVPAIIRSIYAYHVYSNGWCDIGYNFLVDRFGNIWEGRYGGITRPVIGAHTGGFNTNTFGTAIIGTYDSVAPSSAALTAVGQLFGWKFSLYGVDPLGKATVTAASFSGSKYAAGTQVTFNAISGHRDADYTTCPGDAAYNALGTIRSIAKQYIGTGGTSPYGSLDGTDTTLGALRVRGWAADPDMPTTTDPVTVVVDVTNWTTIMPTLSRPDVAAAFPQFGPNHGFDTWIRDIPEGRHQVCLWAQGLPADPDTRLGCVTVTITHQPIGSLDTASAVAGGAVLGGWTLDPDSTAPISYQAYVDVTPMFVGQASSSRPDVGAAFPGYGSNHGYSQGIYVPSGRHGICVNGLNVGPGTDQRVGCTVVTVPSTGASGPPFGSVDIAQRTSSGSLRVAGWVIDPDTAVSTDAHVYVDGVGVAILHATGYRPDVGAAFPVYGSYHGFDVTLPLASGSHQVCVYGINLGPGPGNTTLRCTTVS